MTDETYNGWANRETWAVALHVNNDQGWQESVLDALRNGPPEPLAAWHAGELIRENVEGFFEMFAFDAENMDAVRSFLAMRDDIGSLWRVDWSELGAAFLADIAEEGDQS